MEQGPDLGFIKVALNLVIGKHHHQFTDSDHQELTLTSTKDSVLIHLEKEHGQKLTERTQKLEDGTQKHLIF